MPPTPAKILETPLFRFADLPNAEAKASARSWTKEHYIWDQEYETVRDDLRDILHLLGLDNLQLSFSLSNCQGDGVAFSGMVNQTMLFDAWQKGYVGQEWLHPALPPENLAKCIRDQEIVGGGSASLIIFTIQNGIRYSHANSMTVECQTISPDGEVGYNETIGNEFHEWLKTVSRFCERQGYKTIDQLNSDEYAEETIEANELLFTVKGKRTINVP
jgi:hypothetical protein